MKTPSAASALSFVLLHVAVMGVLACCTRSARRGSSEQNGAGIRDFQPAEQAAMAAYDAKEWDTCAHQFEAIAKSLDGERRANALYSAACCYALGSQSDLAFSSMNAAIQSGLHSVDQVQEDPDLVSLRSDSRWSSMIAAMAAWETSLTAPELRRELLALAREDQAVRKAFIEQQNHGGVPDWTPVTAIDEKSSSKMRDVIALHGWPGKTAVGEDGAHAAWLLVQHSKDLALQNEALLRMRMLLETGEVSKVDFAYLEDRVAVAEHRKQRYGTQFNGSEPHPIDDEANVDMRRKAIGLDTMSEYKDAIRKQYGSAQSPASSGE